MRTAFTFRSLLLAASLCAPVAAAHAQAPTAELAAPASTQPEPVAEFKPTTLLKLGTGLTRQTVYGPGTSILVPVVLGAERQFSAKWSAYGNLTGVSRFSKRPYYQEDASVAMLTGLGLDLGVRRYYNLAKRQAKGRASGPLVGNYLALETTTDFFRYRARLYHESTSLVALWGMQRRLDGHGLVDAYAGLGIESLYWDSSFFGESILPTVQAGLKISLVR